MDAPSRGPVAKSGTGLPPGIPAEIVMADTAYDADPLDKHLYAQRHLVECYISKLKQFRRVATRFEKAARNYLAVVTLAAIVLWMG